MSWFKRLRGVTDSPAREPVSVSVKGRADSLLAHGRYREASDCLSQLATERSLTCEEDGVLGWVQLHLNDPVAARATFQRVLAKAPGDAEAMRGEGESALAQGLAAEAVQSFQRALKVRLDHVPTLRSLGEALTHGGDPVGAESVLQRALALDPDDARGHDLLGMARLHARGPAAALDAFARAYELEKASDLEGNGFHNYAITLAEVGRLDESLATFEEGLATRPDPFAFFTHSLALLRAGRFEQGWYRHEFRWLTREFVPKRPTFAFPEWTGQELRGKRVALLAEQGFGDTLQFVRYARQVRDLGAHVSVIAHADLATLLRSVPGVDSVPSDVAELGAPDYFIELLSLPHALGTTLESVPSDVPYLRPGDDARARWRGLTDGEGTKAGIVWAGNRAHARDVHRSVSLDVLEPLFRVPGVRWFSLQKAHPNERDADLLARWNVQDLAPQLSNFEETAAAIERLDLVVTVDTSVAHLAGGLGKKVWLLLPVHPDFRWMEERQDSPWYPSMRIFRQRNAGNWQTVASDVARAVAADANEVVTTVPSLPAARPVASQSRQIETVAVANTAWGMLEYLTQGDEGASLARYAEWLPLHLDALRQLVPSDAYVLEVNPGAGTHSIAIESGLSSRGHLMLMECTTLERRMLRHNLVGNNLYNHTILQQDLLGLAIDELELERLGVLKLGADEGTAHTLDGTRATLWRHRPTVVIGALAPDAARATLADCGYRLFRFDALLYRADNFAGRLGDYFRGRQVTWTFAFPEESALVAPDLAGWKQLI